MKQVQMVECVCGQYHKLEDCETIIIKVVKGKNCEMKKKEEIIPSYTIPKRDTSVPLPNSFSPVTSNTTSIFTPEEELYPIITPEERAKERKIVPPAIARMMIDSSQPNFETHGDKEKRIV